MKRFNVDKSFKYLKKLETWLKLDTWQALSESSFDFGYSQVFKEYSKFREYLTECFQYILDLEQENKELKHELEQFKSSADNLGTNTNKHPTVTLSRNCPKRPD